MSKPKVTKSLRRYGIGYVLLCAFFATGFVQHVAANLFDAPEPLPPEQVFIPELRSVDEHTISVEFSIEDGYYLYRDKLAFSVEDVIAAEQRAGNLNLSLIHI